MVQSEFCPASCSGHQGSGQEQCSPVETPHTWVRPDQTYWLVSLCAEHAQVGVTGEAPAQTQELLETRMVEDLRAASFL